MRELQSIVNYENVTPAISPAFNTNCTSPCTVLTCSCTHSGQYWSSSSYAFFPQSAWLVLFVDGVVTGGGTEGLFYVRAVRGGP